MPTKKSCAFTPRRMPKDPKAGRHHLAQIDPALGLAIDSIGKLPDRSQPATLLTLCKSVVGQQVSVKAAAAINRRFCDTMKLPEGAKDVTPEALLSIEEDVLRSAGLSQSKARTVKGLAEVWQREGLAEKDWGKLSDEEIIALLTAVKGIGPWTVKMFLIFALKRPDVLPQEDLGLRAGMQLLYNLEKVPTPKECVALAKNWTPWSSLATLYCWHWLHLKRG